MSSLPDVVTVEPLVSLEGSIQTPGDKSISHRALMLSALSDGVSSIVGLSPGVDVQSTATIIEQLGARIERRNSLEIGIQGGRDRLRSSPNDLNCGNSGTTMRLMMGVLAGIPGRHLLTGDASLSLRPMDRVAIPLESMGASVRGTGERLTAPITVDGAPLSGIDYTIPVPSAQVKSALLLAGLSASGPTVLIEPVATRQHTEEMLREVGIHVETVASEVGDTITLVPGAPSAHHWSIPADPSNAAFFLIAGLLAQEGNVTCTNLYAGSTRTGFIGVLERMGGQIESRPRPNGSIDVTTQSSTLIATEIHASEIPSLDEVPILTVAAAGATGVTKFFEVDELRIKESDRFEASIALARSLGAAAWSEGSTLCVEGLGSPRNFSEIDVDSSNDHRLALSGLIGACVGAGGTISGFQSVETNYPMVLADLAELS